MSFLEMIDMLNGKLIHDQEDPLRLTTIAEGDLWHVLYGYRGTPHGAERATTTCQLHMRKFNDGDTIVIEPFRADAFPVVKDLAVDRSAFDRVIQAGGYVSVKTGGSPDANATPIPKKVADEAFEAAACIGCGACVAGCKNASAMLFVSAKVSQLALLPQGQSEASKRVINMVQQMDEEGFGNCTNTEVCEAVCRKKSRYETLLV